MKNNFFKHVILITGLMMVLLVAGCGSDEEDTGANNTDSEESYSEAVEYTITGIEPGAGITVTTETAIEEYDSLAGWTLEQSSTAAMMTRLAEAIEKEEPIIITGWNPHWMFAKYEDLKYLEDPKGVYGETEIIKTLARKGLEEDKPNAYKLLDQFHWEVEDMEGIMLESTETGTDIATLAKEWVEEHEDVVSEWTKGVEDVDGVAIELVSTPWDSECSSAIVVAEALRTKGFEVTITPVDVAVVFKAVAEGDGDATVAAWMPVTHKEFYNKFEGQFDDLGENLTGAKIGLAVPKYMDIDSIEDLKPAE